MHFEDFSRGFKVDGQTLLATLRRDYIKFMQIYRGDFYHHKYLLNILFSS